MLLEKETNIEVGNNIFPQILALNSGGEALHWISYQESAYYAAKERILWSTGAYEMVLRGGTCAATGLQSKLVIDTIIALDNDTSPSSYRRAIPALSNRELFVRDRNLCAYCGNVFPLKGLTRDHVMPRSKGGPDEWNNVVTCCKPCNQRKDDKTPTQAHMELLYIPYIPTYNEALILKNRRILADQMEYLLKGVSKKSRLHDSIRDGRFIDTH
jgi:hypothetical protein